MNEASLRQGESGHRAGAERRRKCGRRQQAGISPPRRFVFVEVDRVGLPQGFGETPNGTFFDLVHLRHRPFPKMMRIVTHHGMRPPSPDQLARRPHPENPRTLCRAAPGVCTASIEESPHRHNTIPLTPKREGDGHAFGLVGRRPGPGDRPAR